jgi:FtsZ-binding cell division protein ZapB
MREQSWEIEDLKEQIVQLPQEKKQIAQLLEVQRDGVQSTEDDREQLRKVKAHLLGHIQQRDHVIARLKHELCNRNESIQSLTKQMRDAVEKQENLEAINRSVAERNWDLSQTNSGLIKENWDLIMRYLPLNVMSDDVLRNQWDGLHGSISSWVDQATLEPEELEERLESLPATLDEWPELVRTHLGNGHVRMAKEYLVTQPLLLKYFINCFLAASILSEDTCLFGLHSAVVGFMRDTEQGMKLLKPKRGTCRRSSFQRPDELFDQPYSCFRENLT